MSLFLLCSNATTATAAALPAASTAGAKRFAGTRATVGTAISFPAGDWSVGCFFRLEKTETNNSGYIFVLNTSTAGGQKIYAWYDLASGRIHFGGTDDASVTLGAHAGSPISGTTNLAVASNYLLPGGVDCCLVFQKTGNKAQIWMKFNGHAPVLAAEEYTTFGAVAAQTFRFARNFSDANPLSPKMRNFFKLSYALTKDQIDKFGNGTDPTTFGTYAADDFYFPFNDASNSSQASTINGLVTALGGTTTQTVSGGLGYAPQTDAVFLDPIGPDGFVTQQQNGSATVAISGTYQGADGYNIQAQLIDDQNKAFKGWQTVATATSGGTWSGSLVVPKGKRWIKIQLRKAGKTDIMTTTLRWGVGENVLLTGQSLMQYLGILNDGAHASYGNKTLNGYVSYQTSFGVPQSGSVVETLTVTGAASNGGLIEITTTAKHGRKTGEKVVIKGIVGTTEANNQVWTITVTGLQTFTLNGSTFVNAYSSGGSVIIGKHIYTVPDQSYQTYADAQAILANAISNIGNTVVSIANRAVSGTAIASHDSYSGSSAPFTILAGHGFKRVGGVIWNQGHNDIGLSPLSQYYSSGGSSGAWTGWGLLGTLFDFMTGQLPNNDFNFTVTPFPTTGGTCPNAAQNQQDFRWGMYDWCVRKIAAGVSQVYATSWQHDFQPQWENSLTTNAHLIPALRGTWSMAARLGHDYGTRIAGIGNTAFGPKIVSATRSGATIDLTVQHNGGASLKTLTNGAVPSGFEVATDTGFTSIKTISNVQIINATTVRITLSADPGATCYVRYMFGRVGDYAALTYQTPRITGVADNGAGLIRVTCSTVSTDVTPNGSQKVGGHGLVTGQWVSIQAVKGATQANGDWQVNVIDSQNFDLVGSSSAGLGTFVAGSNLYQASATGVVAVEVGIPIYDDRTIGGADTNGAPLQPVFTYLTAA